MPKTRGARRRRLSLVLVLCLIPAFSAPGADDAAPDRAVISRAAEPAALHSGKDGIDLAERSGDPDAATPPRLLLGKGEWLKGEGEYEEAAAVFAALIAEFQDSRHPEVEPYVLAAMSHQVELLEKTGDLAEALEMADRVIAAAGENPIPDKRGAAANARLRKGLLLNRIGDRSAALNTFGQLIAGFQGDADPEVKTAVDAAGRMMDRLRRRAAPTPRPERSGFPPWIMFLPAGLGAAVLILRRLRED